MLEGKRFTLFTDHKPLTYALAKGSEPWTVPPRKLCGRVTSDIRHIEGTDNVVVDMVSKLPPAGVATVATVPQTLDYAAVATAQRDCPRRHRGS